MGVIRFVVIFAFIWTSSSDAFAQDDAARARELFEEGSVAMAEGRVADARDMFRASLDLAPRPATAFNLAVALREVGALLDALSTYEALLVEDYGALERAQRREVQQTIADTRRQLGRLVITVDGTDGVLLRVDGRALETVDAGARVEVPVDPGDHVITARAAGSESVERQVAVAQGEEARVPFTLEPTVEEPTTPPVDQEDDEGTSGLLSSPWPWVIFGVLAAAGAAVAIAVTVGAGEPEPEPLPDDLVLGRVMTLSF